MNPETPETPMGPPAKDPRIGTVLDGKLEVTRVLGRGGMGVVYLARQRSMDRDVAVKVLHPHSVADPDAIQRFLHEAKVASKLRHPNVITVFDFGHTADGVLYLVMELLGGAELASVVESQGALPPARVVHLMTQVCDAVHHAHGMGLIHRDLKPENVFLMEGSALRGDFVKVLDFGIARVQAVEGAERLTRTGVMCGTPAYMSPEQILGDDVDARSDIYSLGVMLFELLTGRLPFMADSQMRLLMMHLESPVPGLDALEAKVPTELYDVVKKALAKKPADRYQSALDLANALVAALDGARNVGGQDVDRVLAASGGQGRVTGPRAALAETGIDTSTPSRSERALVARDTIEPRAKRVLEREVADKPARRTWMFVAAAALVIGAGAVVAATSGGEANEPPRVATTPPTVDNAATAPAATASAVTAPAPTRLAAADAADAGPSTPDVAFAVAAEVVVPEVAPAEPEVVAAVDASPVPAAPLPVIALVTDPPGALVLVDGAKLGTTPLSIPRPKPGASAKLAIKLAGHTPLEQVITSDTADLTLALDKLKKRPGADGANGGPTAGTPRRFDDWHGPRRRGHHRVGDVELDTPWGAP